jgi:hypothetical protein
MGPLVPFIISEEFSLVIAFFLGIAFGFILEQAGFRPRKNWLGFFMATILPCCACFLLPELRLWPVCF